MKQKAERANKRYREGKRRKEEQKGKWENRRKVKRLRNFEKTLCPASDKEVHCYLLNPQSNTASSVILTSIDEVVWQQLPSSEEIVTLSLQRNVFGLQLTISTNIK